MRNKTIETATTPATPAATAAKAMRSLEDAIGLVRRGRIPRAFFVEMARLSRSDHAEITLLEPTFTERLRDLTTAIRNLNEHARSLDRQPS